MWGGDGAVVCADSVRVSLPYEFESSAATTLGALYSQQFRGNSVYDPDLTGVGAQPTGFDQWAAFFNEYLVVSSFLEIEIVCGTVAPVEWVVFPSYNSTLPSTTLDASARPYAKRVLLLSSGNSVKGRMRLSMSTAQMMGVREEAVLDDDAYGATVSTNPGSSAVWYWTVVAQNIASTTTLADSYRVRIVYDVLFHDRIQLSLSSTRLSSSRRTGETGADAAAPDACDASCLLEDLVAVRRVLEAAVLKLNSK